MSTRVFKFLALVLCLGLLFSAPAPARAQVSGATLTGTITDPQAGVVVGAKISAQNVATGVTSDTETNSAGLYSIVNLNPGDYAVSITATGFSTTTSKVTLFVGQTQQLSIALTVGQVSQTVEVTGAAPTVETTNATLSGEVQGSQIVELPLNGRDWVSLAALTPGVAQVRPQEVVTSPGGATRGLGIQMTINGARPQQNVYRLNGVIVNDYSNAGPGSVLGANAGVDAIQEFSVLTGNYSAEYGDTSGGVINAVTKSGTNSLHGSAYEFIRNDHLDASNRFEDPTLQNCPNAANCDPPGKGIFIRNQFGASAGWKIFKDKLFVFGNYEGLRQQKAVPQQGAVLTANARLGIINDVCGNPPGTAYATAAAVTSVGGAPPTCAVSAGGSIVPEPILTGSCPFQSYDPNGMTNQAPGKASVCVDNAIFAEINPCTGVTPCPSGAPAGVLAPLPNGEPLSPANNDDAYYNSDGGQIATDNYATIRADYRISDKDSLVGSWYRDTSDWRRPGLAVGPFLSYSGFTVPHGAYTLDETHILSTTMVNDFRLGLDQSNLASPSFSNANPVAHATTLCVVPYGGGSCVSEQIGILPMWVAGGGSIGGNGNSGNATTVSGAGGGFTGAGGFSARTSKIEVFDDITKTIGKHTLKIGVEAIDDHEDWLSGPALNGGGGPSFGTITGGAGCASASPLEAIGCGGGVASYLSDIPHTVRMPIEPPFAVIGTVHHWRSQIYGGYLQDDWKMKTNLTVNLGLRYEMSTIPYETDNNENNVESITQNLPSVSQAGACVAPVLGNGQQECPGFYHTTFQTNPTLTNFEPRLGFAWDPFKDGKTSIRGGAGIFDELPLSYIFALNSLQTAPSAAETDLSYSTSAATLLTQTGTGCGGAGCGGGGWGHFPLSEAADVTNPNLVSNSGAAQRWSYIQPNPKRPYVLQYNLNIQRQITNTITLMIAYAGSKSWHGPFQEDDLNLVVPYKTSAGYLWPDPIGSGCLPGNGSAISNNCSQTLANLGYSPTYINAAPINPLCINGTVTPSSSGCLTANLQNLTSGVLINSHSAQFQTSLFEAQSWYNSLQVRVDKRVSHGLYIGAAFTWGKSFDTSSSSFASDNYSNNPSAITPWWDTSLDKGLSDFNVTKNLTFNFLYTVPTPESWHGPLQWVTGGWGIGGNFDASDGTPLWPLITSETLGMGGGGAYDIPQLVPGCQQALTSSGRTGALQYLNPACYTLPTAPNMAYYNGTGTIGSSAYQPGCDHSYAYPTCANLLGNDPRNVVIGPGLINMDFSITKDNHIRRISETADLQFRAEIFNIANHPNYGFPSAGNLAPIDQNGNAVGGFGVLSNTQTPERQIQFALKLIY